MIKIVIPTNDKNGLESLVAEHFGRCQTYTFLNEKGEILEIISNTSEHGGGHGLPPELMKKNQVNILLCKGLGLKALNLCQDLGIEVFISQAKKVKDIFQLWKDQKLKSAQLNEACQH
jgi:predicted Fe-Mo cluster-binding NifX family protein